MKHKSEQLIDDLRANGAVINESDEALIQVVIRNHFIDIHRNAVEQTHLAHNKLTYVEPQFYDK